VRASSTELSDSLSTHSRGSRPGTAEHYEMGCGISPTEAMHPSLATASSRRFVYEFRVFFPLRSDSPTDRGRPERLRPIPADSVASLTPLRPDRAVGLICARQIASMSRPRTVARR